MLKYCEQNKGIDYKSVKQLVSFDITIDSKTISVTDDSKNIIEIAKSAGIAIPAPCFLAKPKKGC